MSSSIRQIAGEFLSGNTEDVVDPVTFIESPWGLGVKMLPVQKFIIKAYYSMELDNRERAIRVPDVTNERTLFEFTEVEFIRWLHEEGRCNTDSVDGKTFRELILVVGRRGTKSTIASFISNYEIYKLVKRGDPSTFYNFPPDTVFSVLNVAPTDEQAQIVFNMISSMALKCRFLHNRSLHQTMTYFDVMTDQDAASLVRKKRATIISLAGGCSSNSLRGRNAIVVIMDEFAHFLDNNGRFSGREVYKALTPSTVSFRKDGKVITISSPYAKYGAFWDRYQQSFDEQETTLMFRMYSAMSNPTIDSAILRAEKRRDKVGFMCEYGGEFSDSITAWIEDEEVVLACCTERKISPRGLPGVQYYVGIDLGFKNDGTAIVIVHREGGKYVVDYYALWFSASSDVWDQDSTIYKDCDRYKWSDKLKMAYVREELEELKRWFTFKKGIFDQHNGEGLMEILLDAGLTQFGMKDFGDRTSSEMYKTVKNLLIDGLIDMPGGGVLSSELLSLEAERKHKQKIAVRAPAKPGAHDDLSDAFVRAVWLCYEATKEKREDQSRRQGTARIHDQKTNKRFQVDRQKMHGSHPRYGGLKKRKAAAAVTLPVGGVGR